MGFGVGDIVFLTLTAVGVPAMILSFVYNLVKNKRELDKIKYQKEMLELEVEKERLKIKALEEENRKLDRIIDSGGTSGLLN
jgi:spore coat polysaccharide biosynthesis predicted glycosyltransferase SpsG